MELRRDGGVPLSEHYYASKPTAASRRQTYELTVRGVRLQLTTDAGVFSKQGLDYGSKALIERMDIPPGSRVLDVGCGYGPIGLTAALLAPEGHADLVDVNERAVELARLNAEANGIRNVDAMQSDGLAAVSGKTYDVILTNPPIRAGKAVVHRIFEESAARLAPGGALWIVIQNKQGAPSARAKLEALFGEEAVEEVGKDKGYRILKAVNKKSLT